MTVTQFSGHAEIYENFAELVAAAPARGVILAGIDSGEAAGLLSELHSAGLLLPVILFAENPSPTDIVRAAHEGVADFLSWPFSGDELASACAYGRSFMKRRGEMMGRQHRSVAMVDALSQRERQILVLMIEGLSNKNMAAQLDLSPRTIEDYRLNMMKKLEARSSGAAIRIGLEAGLQPESLAA